MLFTIIAPIAKIETHVNVPTGIFFLLMKWLLDYCL